MILAAAVAASLVMPVSIDHAEPLPLEPALDRSVPPARKSVAIRPLMNRATDCIARTVWADPRFATADPAARNNLIVDSVPSCIAPLRAMIDAYDQMFGDGAGEKFFMGPYLDALPEAIRARVKDAD
jgi:hypothetical protein